MSEKGMRRLSLEEIRARKSETDWKRVREQGDFLGDQEISVDWSQVDLVEPEPKKMISLRVDADVLDFFRSQGPGYQTRMNAVLRAYKKSVQGL